MVEGRIKGIPLPADILRRPVRAYPRTASEMGRVAWGNARDAVSGWGQTPPDVDWRCIGRPAPHPKDTENFAGLLGAHGTPERCEKSTRAGWPDAAISSTPADLPQPFSGFRRLFRPLGSARGRSRQRQRPVPLPRPPRRSRSTISGDRNRRQICPTLSPPQLAEKPRHGQCAATCTATRWPLFHTLLPDPSPGGEVHVYFPDPWWKKTRHRKRRVINTAFVRDVERRLSHKRRLALLDRRRGLLYRNARVLILAETHLRGPLPVGEFPTGGNLDYRTHFEADAAGQSARLPREFAAAVRAQDRVTG